MDAVAPDESRDHLPFAQHHAFIIGINTYQHVASLQTAADDARRLADVLAGQQHFRVHPALLDAKGSEIRALLRALSGHVGADDRVFFYFAGHGIAADGDDGPAGYIVPSDYDPDDPTTLIPMADLQAALDALPCRHLLLVLDCCFSGAFKWSSKYRAIGSLMPKKIYKERFDRFIEDPAWQVITSAAYDQKALDVVRGKATGDRGITTSDDNGAHSPFARALFEGLGGAADARLDAEGDGVITATELYAYIRDQVEPQTIEEGERLRQTPGFFPLKKHDKGEFIFLHPRHRLNLPPIPKRSPYKGLESFNEEDQLLFYGRDRVIRDLRAKAEDNKLLVVSGASGTGKSSVIKAGLLPQLRAEGFRILPVIRPGSHPLAELEQALGPGAVGQPGSILLVDQFEEVITRCADPDERRKFDARLLDLLDTETNIHRIILTVRADFEPQLSGGALKSYWMAGRCTVPPFSLEDLKQVIVMPTMQEVLIFDPPQLVDGIIAEVVQAPGALPLLSYALAELYEAYRASGRQDRALKKEDYDKLGGVMGALRTRADTLLRELAPPDRDTMRKLMLRLVSVEGDLAGKRVPTEDLAYSDAEQPRVDNVLEKLVDARLIVKGDNYIEPAHDALVRAWKTLHEWIQQVGKDALFLGAKLNAAAREFERSKDDDFLWHNHPNLPMAEAALRAPTHWFNASEIAFVARSVARRTALSEAERKRILDELCRLATLRLTPEVPALLTGDRAGGHERAVQQVLAARMLGGPSLEVLGAMAFAVEFLRYQVKLVDAGAALFSVAFSPRSAGARCVSAGVGGKVQVWDAATLTPIDIVLDGPAGDLFCVAYSPDGARIAAAGLDGKLWLWDAGDGRRVAPPPDDYRNAIRSLAFSADGMRILTGGVGGTLQIRDARTGAPIGEPLDTGADVVTGVAFSPDGKRIVAGGDATLLLATEKKAGGWSNAALKVPEAGFRINAVAFSPDGARIASGESDGRVRLWDTRTRKPIGKALEAHSGEVQSVAFSPDGSYLVAGAEAGSIVLWDVATGERKRDLLRGQHGAVMGLAWSRDGRRIISGGEDGLLRLWDPGAAVLATVPRDADAAPAARLTNSAEGLALLSADDTRRIVGYRNGRLRLWDAMTQKPLSDPIAGHEMRAGRDATAKEPKIAMKALAFSADRARIASGSENGTIRIWNAAPLRPMGELLAGHEGAVTSVAFSPDGSTLVSVGEDGTLRLWDAERCAPIGAPLQAQQGKLVDVAYDADGLRIVARSAGGTLSAWPAPETWASLLCSKITRNMSRQQWSDWVSPEIEYRLQCQLLPVPEQPRAPGTR